MKFLKLLSVLVLSCLAAAQTTGTVVVGGSDGSLYSAANHTGSYYIPYGATMTCGGDACWYNYEYRPCYFQTVPTSTLPVNYAVWYDYNCGYIPVYPYVYPPNYQISYQPITRRVDDGPPHREKYPDFDEAICSWLGNSVVWLDNACQDAAPKCPFDSDVLMTSRDGKQHCIDLNALGQ